MKSNSKVIVLDLDETLVTLRKKWSIKDDIKT